MGLIDLVEVERDVQALCLREQPPAAALEALGVGDNRHVWLLYREMVRERFFDELQVALPRSCAAAGSAALLRAFEVHLEQAPPRTRFFREVPLAFAKSALQTWQQDAELRASLPAYLCDLVRYEAALWEVTDLVMGSREGLTELAFDKPLVLSGALRLLSLSHAVNKPADAHGGYASAPTYLAVHRASDVARVQTWQLNAVSYDLMTLWQTRELSVTDAAQLVTKQRGLSLTPEFVDGLCGVLADFIERGLILGSRA